MYLEKAENHGHRIQSMNEGPVQIVEAKRFGIQEVIAAIGFVAAFTMQILLNSPR